jgi:hypothetical protein
MKNSVEIELANPLIRARVQAIGDFQSKPFGIRPPNVRTSAQNQETLHSDIVCNADIAAQLIGGCDAMCKEIGHTRPKLEQADVDKIISTCIVKMGEAAFQRHMKKVTRSHSMKQWRMRWKVDSI